MSEIPLKIPTPLARNLLVSETPTDVRALINAAASSVEAEVIFLRQLIEAVEAGDSYPPSLTVTGLHAGTNSSGNIETQKVVGETISPLTNGTYYKTVGGSTWIKVPGDLNGQVAVLILKTFTDSFSTSPCYLNGLRIVDKRRDGSGRVANAIFATGETFIARLSRFCGFENAQLTRVALGVESAVLVTAKESVVGTTYMDGKKVLRKERDGSGRIAHAVLEDGTVKIDLLDARRVVNPAALRVALGLGTAALLNTENIPIPVTPIAADIYQRAVAKYKAGSAMSPWEALALSRFRLVDIIGIGDSNQLHSGNGWDHAIGAAMSSVTRMYASPLYMNAPVNPGYSTAAQGFGTATVTPPSPPWASYWICAGELPNGVVESDGAGIIIQSDSALNVNSSLEWTCLYATFETGSGQFTPLARREDPPYTGIGGMSPINTNTGPNSASVQRATFSISAATRNFPIKMGAQIQPTTATGPVTIFSQRIRDMQATYGWSMTTFLGIGGFSLYNMISTFRGYAPQAVVNYFTELRRYQIATTGLPVFVFVLNSGLNDRNATNPSAGWRAVTPGDSPSAYVDNAEAIVAFFENVWESQGWSKDELHWLIIPSHRIADPDDSELLSYRAAAKSAFDGKPRFDVVDIGLIMTQAEGLANAWYQSGPDFIHMSTAGHTDVFRRILINRGLLSS